MPKSYWTRIQTPNGLKYFRADDVTDELMQKIKDEADSVFYAEICVTPFDEIKAAYDRGDVIMGKSGGDVYPLYSAYLGTSYSDSFSFACLHGNVWYLWTCYQNSTGYEATNGWATPPGMVFFPERANIADEYSNQRTYAVGALCYNGSLFRCTTDISVAEPWTQAHWTQTTVADEFKRTSNIDTWTEVQISSVSAAVTDFHWCKMYYNDTLKMYSLNFWCTISDISSLSLGWNNLFEVDIQDAPNILNFACRSRRGDANVWISENLLEQIGFIKTAGKVYLCLFNSDTTSSGERLYYAPTIMFPATYFSGT